MFRRDIRHLERAFIAMKGTRAALVGFRFDEIGKRLGRAPALIA
jgi:hypothetical protein